MSDDRTDDRAAADDELAVGPPLLGTIESVSVAVRDIDAAVSQYTEGLGFEVTRQRRASKRGFNMDWVELGVNGRTVLELIQPTADSGPVAGFLESAATSRVYQIRFVVDDLDATLQTAEQRGLRVIHGQDVEGDPRVGWIHPKSTSGVLIELLERESA